MITTDFSILEKRKFDVCVVGSGLVGSCLAADLEYRGLSVLVLELGLVQPDRWHQSLGDALITSPQHHHPMSVAVSRSLGGTSALWGGRCVPLDEIDFVKRKFVPHSGWPISYDDITRYERRAAELLGCDDGGFTIDELTNCRGINIASGKLERWVNETRIVKQLSKLGSSDRIVILLNATVVDISVKPGERTIKGISVVREGQRVEFEGARNFVLALGGIETSRLLLNVQGKYPELFGGTSGPLGRYYMGHISGSLAHIKFYDPNQSAYFSNLEGKRSFARRRFTLRTETLLENELLNIAFWPDNAALVDPNHENGFLSLIFLLLNSPNLTSSVVAAAIRAMHTSKKARYWPHIRNLIRDFGSVAIGTTQVIQQRGLYGRRVPRFFVKSTSGVYPLHFHSEQTPQPNNRVRLVADRDWLGMGRVAVDFAFSPEDLSVIRQAHGVLDRALRTAGLGELIYDKIAEANESLPQVAPDGLHQIGLTRMSSGPSTGVVNRDCRVFDFENLYIAGSSVFPTSGQASPTLPAVALAVRLSEHLVGRSNGIATCSSKDVCGKRPLQRAKALNILFVTASYYPAVRYGGPIYTVHSLARSLAKRGNRVVVYTTNVDGDKTSDTSAVYSRILDDVTVNYFPVEVDRIYWSQALNKSLLENAGQFDVVHAQGAFLYPTIAARRAATRSGSTFVYSPRGMLVEALIKKKNYLAKSLWVKCFEAANCKRAAFLHATSDVEAYEIKHLGLRPRVIEVIPNGLDMPERESEDEEEARRQRLVERRRRYVIILGRISWKKGIDRLIRAMAFVPSIDLVIAGNDDENYTPQLMSLVRAHGLEDRVVFTGAVYGMDKFALLRGAELFVLPSYSESFGVVLLEALCCGCPVIMAPEVGISKDLERLGAGITVPGLPEEIGGAIQSLLADPGRRKRMSDSGRRAVKDRFSWDDIATNMEAAYRRAQDYRSN